MATEALKNTNEKLRKRKNSLFRKALKNTNEKLRRRKNSLFRKAYELGTLCNVDVAVIVRKNGRYFTYRSINEESWPPGMKDIQISYPLLQDLHPQDMQVQDESPTGMNDTEGYEKKKSDIDQNNFDHGYKLSPCIPI